MLFLFGSKAKGGFREDSDLDLAYLSDQDIAEYEQYMLAQKLAKLSGHEVDLIDLNKASTVLRSAIKKKLTAMVGFRNIAVHNYQEINIKIIKNIIENTCRIFWNFAVL